MTGSIPKKATVADPALVLIAPGKGVTTMEPVSVCLHIGGRLAAAELVKTELPHTSMYPQPRTASSQRPHYTNSKPQDLWALQHFQVS
jgi:hypothetical protein